ncbi:MAG: sialate O-acetylesterase [Flavobacteriaceae bacterium]|nr:sialate O-acetylesterase [Flavobacteriaceae bacterium]
MKTCLLFSIFMASLLSCTVTSEDAFKKAAICEGDAFSIDDSKYKIILVIGQSNTHQGLGLDPNIDIPLKGVVQLGRFEERDMQLVDATEPLDHHTVKANRIGFALTFANLFKQELLAPEDALIIVPCGHSGTGFEDNMWNKGDTLYNDAVNRVNHLLKNYRGSKLQAILWHQGERDINNKNYENALTAFVEDIRTDLNQPNVPFILGGMVPYWVNQRFSRRKHQAIIAGIKNNVCYTAYADPTSPFRIEKKDNSKDAVHYDAAGQREMGLRYFQEYLKLIESN